MSATIINLIRFSLLLVQSGAMQRAQHRRTWFRARLATRLLAQSEVSVVVNSLVRSFP